MANGVILDTNCFAHVFNHMDARHSEFSGFLDWLCFGPGFLVFGGSKYLAELKKSGRYLKVFSILAQYNKARVYDAVLVNTEMERIAQLVGDASFDDPHLAAIVIVSKSEVICTGDARCIPFLKRKDIYEGRSRCPRFYTGDRCMNLLSIRFVGRQCNVRKTESKHIVEKIARAIGS